jgi:hypothetical protein
MIKKILPLLIILILVIVGLAVGHSKYWWFTPASGQRQTIQDFFSDISKNQDTAAYKLTSSKFQSINTYTNFQSDFSTISNQLIKVHYSGYLVNKGVTSINGTITSGQIKTPAKFGINIIKSAGKYKVDSIAAVFTSN